MNIEKLTLRLTEVAHGNAVIVAVLATGFVVAALAWRCWPFYRAMLVGHAEAQPADGRARYDALDGLRGILCLLVVVHHAAIALNLSGPRGDWGEAVRNTAASFRPGNLAVAMFFAVTGFLFYVRAVERPGAFADVGKFFVGRAARVGPALLVSCGLMLVADVATHRMFDGPTLTALGVRIVTLGGSGGALLAERADVGLPQNAGVFWTLTFEWLFYLAFPLLAAAVVAGVPVVVRIVACAGVAGLAAGGITLQTPVLMFLAGIVAVHLIDRPFVRRLASGPLAPIALAGLGVGLPVVAYHLPGGPWGWASMLLITFAFTLVVAGCDCFGLLRLPALRAVGAASYSVYLYHGIALYAARSWLLGLADRPLLAWSAVCALTAATVLVSMVSYRWIEHPGIEFGRQVTKRLAARRQAVSAPRLRSLSTAA